MSGHTQDTAHHGALLLDAGTFGWLLDAEPSTLRMLHDARHDALSLPAPRDDARLYRDADTAHRGAAEPMTQDDGHDVQDDDGTAAAIVETWTHDYRDEWHDDDTMTVWCIARLVTGCAEWVGTDDAGRLRMHVGSAHGDIGNARRLRTLAREDAETSARAHRTACRAVMSCIGRDDDARGAGWLDGESYAALRRAVMRWTFGNAARRTTDDAGRTRYGSAHVRAGITSNGMPLDVHTLDDATQYAALIVQRWMTHGLPESVETLTADLDDDAACRVVIGTAARDGLRMTTRHKSATALARKTAAHRDAAASHVNTDDGIARQDTARVVMATTGRTAYAASSSDALRTDALLARVLRRDDTTGRLKFPTLALLVLSDGHLDDAARTLGRTTAAGRCTNAARVAILRAARAEWDALTEYDGTTYDDAAEWLDGLTFAR